MMLHPIRQCVADVGDAIALTEFEAGGLVRRLQQVRGKRSDEQDRQGDENVSEYQQKLGVRVHAVVSNCYGQVR
jgi:hypothetical protein